MKKIFLATVLFMSVAPLHFQVKKFVRMQLYLRTLLTEYPRRLLKVSIAGFRQQLMCSGKLLRQQQRYFTLLIFTRVMSPHA